MTKLSRLFCPGAGRWERARAGGLDRGLLQHLLACEACRGAWEADARLRALATKLPVRALSTDRLAARREALLVHAQAQLASGQSERTLRRTGQRFWAHATAAALVAGGVWLGAARVREPAESHPPTTSVAQTVAKEEARVKPPVQSASSASLGTVASAREAGPDASAGRELSAPSAIGASPSARSESSASPRGKAAVSRRPLRESSAGDAVENAATSSRPLGTVSEAAFREGWVALRAGHPALAAQWFASVEDGSAVAEDAHYWQGVSLARAARLEQAVAVLERFVARYPRSLRRSEAALVLGWVHLQRNAEKRAASYFAEAMLTDDPATRQKAAHALARLNERARLSPKHAAAL